MTAEPSCCMHCGQHCTYVIMKLLSFQSSLVGLLYSKPHKSSSTQCSEWGRMLVHVTNRQRFIWKVGCKAYQLRSTLVGEKLNVSLLYTCMFPVAELQCITNNHAYSTCSVNYSLLSTKHSFNFFI